MYFMTYLGSNFHTKDTLRRHFDNIIIIGFLKMCSVITCMVYGAHLLVPFAGLPYYCLFFIVRLHALSINK